MNEHVDKAAPHERLTLMFLHGGGLNRTMWQPQIQDLGAEFRTLTLDLPRHGEYANKIFTLDAAVEHVEQVIAHENCGRVLLVGLSLGGYVATTYAAKHPEQVAGLVLSGCCVQYVGLMGLLARISVFALKFVSPRRFGKMQRKMITTVAGTEVCKEIVQTGFSRRGARDGLKAVIGHDFVTLLRRYDGPVLIVNGEHDGLNRKREQDLVGASDNASIEILKDCGHLCSLETPQSFSSAVRRFTQAIRA